MTISSTMQENQVVLKIDGRVDTNTSPQLQSAILDAFQRVSMAFGSILREMLVIVIVILAIPLTFTLSLPKWSAAKYKQC